MGAGHPQSPSDLGFAMATDRLTTRDLIVPDPRVSPVPQGWWEAVALPVVSSFETWEELDEAEGRLLAMASLVESMGLDAIEFEAALRIVEARRGELADIAASPGRPKKSNTHVGLPDDVSDMTVSRWRTIARLGDKLLEHLRSATDRRDRREVTQAAVLRLARPKPGEVPPPEGQYHTIVIDPPWPMAKIDRDVRPNQGPALDYPVMTIEDIAALPVPDLAAAPGAHVYLWTTHRFLPDAFDLFERWGVSYQCVMTWVKNVGITPYSWMYDTEHVLFGRIGQLPLEQLGLRLSFSAPTTGHSVKPDVFYERVEVASPGPRIDLFARRPRDGWDVWGNEVAA